ncbi:MAG: TolC family protein, partial [Prevotellaceae bacterium]|nr:TolC family protein [Prevotellaceae bacterium]
MKRLFFIISVFSFFAVGCLAQQHQWSLQECIQYALDNNITVKQQDITRQQREIDVSTAKNSRLPNLAASASQNWSFGRGLTAENTYTNTNTASTSF